MKVAVHWNDHPWAKANPERWLTFYKFSTKAFGADLVQIGGPKMDVEYYEDIEEAIFAHPDYTVVSLSGKAKTEIGDYKHPEMALYVVGPDHGDVPFVPGEKVRIGDSKLWSQDCVAILLYDRYSKTY